MSLNSVLLFSFLALGQTLATETTHLAWHEADEFVQCAGKLSGKSVYISLGAAEEINRRGPFSCPDKLQALDSLGIPLIAYDQPSFLYFASVDEVSHYMKNDLRELGLSSPVFELDSTTEVRKDSSVPEEINNSILEMVVGSIRREGRPAPVQWQRRAGGKALFVNAHLILDAVRLRPGVLSIVAMIPAGGRLFYGELEKGRFRLIWDSPLVNSNGKWTYRDLDGDGLAEILVTGNALPFYQSLTIFSISGKLLTSGHGNDCFYSALGDVCALLGSEFAFVKGNGSTLDILASGDPHRTDKPRRYRIVNGVYVPASTARSSAKSRMEHP